MGVGKTLAALWAADFLKQAARALHDQQLLDPLERVQDRNERQQKWLKTRISQAAPQVLVFRSRNDLAGYSLLGAAIEVTRSLRDRARVFLIGDHEDDDLRAFVRTWVA